MNGIVIDNHGALIVASNYWGSDLEQCGGVILSPNAGGIRLLWPRAMRAAIEDMRQAEYAICSVGPWPAEGIEKAVEILFEDRSDTPYSLCLSPAQCLLIPGEPEPGREWVLSVWDLKKNRPHKALERRCYWRRVESIPCMKPSRG